MAAPTKIIAHCPKCYARGAARRRADRFQCGSRIILGIFFQSAKCIARAAQPKTRHGRPKIERDIKAGKA
jgi:hypothetical protein